MLYYKIIFAKPPDIGTIINTNKNYDTSRIIRFERLSKLFSLFFHVSSDRKIPLHKILALLYPNKFSSDIVTNDEEGLIKDIKTIEKEILSVNFLMTEFRMFTDYALFNAKKELEKELNLRLPDRFKSHYFFETLEDCLNYHDQIYLDGLFLNSQCTIIQVEFLNNDNVYKMDNTFLRDFQNHHTSLDFYNNAKRFLNQETSEYPLFEIIYQGEYKVKAHSLTI